ncbi:MAG: MopE-related protein [Patescibacteria group bacterium]
MWSECLGDYIAPDGETCDGFDNDCDGEIDEDYKVNEPCDSDDADLCAYGTLVCNEEGDNVVCEDDVNVEEVCNGLDDDCDNLTDEELGSTTCGLGPCNNTVQNCTGGKLQVCDPLKGALKEICNSADDDCDGATDEGLGTLTCGKGACNHTTPACTDGTLQTCDPFLGAVSEICDGLDNDCDGFTDEGFPLNAPCSVGIGECKVAGIFVCNEAGGTTCSVEPLPPTEELCDSLDNDCDGNTDEGLGTTTCGLGVCLHTVKNCIGGESQVCDPMAGTLSETCNLIDDDCDGQVDENLGETNCGLGPCNNTVQNCINGVTQQCNPFLGAQFIDACNGIDDDCDGLVDEEVFEIPCGVGACAHTVLSCLNGAPEQCNPFLGASDEKCNNADDDCDGKTDEDFVDIYGTPCTVGKGECARSSFWVCNSDEADCLLDGENVFCTEDMNLICAVFPLELEDPTSEICDGKDNDCDGSTDEELQPLTCGKGECLHNAPSCIGGVTQQCDPFEGSTPETCDGLDNDCDGETDETFNIGQTCDNGLVGECHSVGIYVCDSAGGVTCWYEPKNQGSEICDGLDNDCDGQTDEELGSTTCGLGICNHEIPNCLNGTPQFCNPFEGALPGENCFNDLDDNCDGTANEGCACTLFEEKVCGTDEGECQSGLQYCKPNPSDPTKGIWSVCLGDEDNPVVTPKPELCDGLDNDCNGETDEGFNLGQLCDNGELGECYSAGINICDGNGSVECFYPPTNPAPELCNGLDDDCDGGTDEDFSNLNQPCSMGLGECTSLGVYVCKGDGSGTVCDAVPPAGIPEVCDALDNDCDGQTDEELGSTTCGLGVCNHTIQNCIGGVTQTCDPMEGASSEVCNLIDDDCNGQTDEDLPSLTCGLGECDHTTPSCVAGVPQTCDPMEGSTSELCNGLDDDCDGGTDEDFSNLNQPCSTGLGECTSLGVYVCKGDGSGTVCDAVPPAGVPETCDGKDNDCDGQTDEELGSTTCGLGACNHTTQNCVGGVTQTCDPLEGASSEVCGDAVDNDCDGTTDEQCLACTTDADCDTDPPGYTCTCNGDLMHCVGYAPLCDTQTGFCYQGEIDYPCPPGTCPCLP